MNYIIRNDSYILERGPVPKSLQTYQAQRNWLRIKTLLQQTRHSTDVLTATLIAFDGQTAYEFRRDRNGEVSK